MRGSESRRFATALAIALGIILFSPLIATPLELSALSDSVVGTSANGPTILRIGMLRPVKMLNPYTAIDTPDYVAMGLIYDRLITYDQNGNPAPLVASSWEVRDWPEADNVSTPDINEGANRIWRYHIVNNATWHDGTPLTAADVAYSINLNINDSMWAFTPYISTRMADYARVVDSTTVDVYLKIPSVLAQTLMIPIVPETIWSQYTPEEIMSNVTNDHPIGSGPFKFVELVEDQHLLLERNTNYYHGKPAYDRLIMVFYGSDQVMAEDLKNGNIDVGRFPSTTFNTLKGKPNIQTAAVDICDPWTIGFNCYTDRTSSGGNPLLLDDNIRRAMQLGLNKSYLINNVWGGYGDIGYALEPPAQPFWHWEPQTPEESLNYNPARANAMLDAAGYDKRNGNGIRLVNRSDNPYAALDTPLSFKFNVRNDAPEDIAAAPYIKAMWKDIGVDVRIEATAESTLATIVYSEASHDVYMWVWGGDYDPTYLLGSMTTDQIWGWNDPFWSNATYDALFLEQLQQTGTDRQSTVFEMEKIFYESSCLMVTSYPYYLFAWNTLHFTNWGDPVAHPARNIVHYFGGGGQLYMELKPVSAGHGGGVSTTVIIGSGIALVIVVGVAVALLVRRGRKDLRRGDGGTEEDKKKTGLD
jgi:peptide/nickel transport system substrate-binding protein